MIPLQLYKFIKAKKEIYVHDDGILAPFTGSVSLRLSQRKWLLAAKKDSVTFGSETSSVVSFILILLLLDEGYTEPVYPVIGPYSLP